MNLRESINKSLRLQELYKSMMYHLQHDAAPEPEKEKFSAAELEKMYGSKSKVRRNLFRNPDPENLGNPGENGPKPRKPLSKVPDGPEAEYKTPAAHLSASDHLPMIHKELTDRGFKHFNDNGYSFYKKDDHIISVNQSNGQWIKSTKGKGRTMGSGHGDLVRYFNQYGNR